MATRTFEHHSLGLITVYKRKGSRRVSVRVVDDKVRVTQPFWVPYAQGIRFAEKHSDWITSQQSQRNTPIADGMVVGKEHYVQFVYGDTLSCRVQGGIVRLTLEHGQTPTTPVVQSKLRLGVKKALVKEAKHYLPERLDRIAQQFGFVYGDVSIKSMRSRWGSCTSQGNISLNCFLMQAPWELIDYVLLHELVHTKHMNHSSAFWQTLEGYMPDYRQRRKTLRQLQATVLLHRSAT